MPLQRNASFTRLLGLFLLFMSVNTFASTTLSNRIVGGEDAQRDYPWMTRLFVYSSVNHDYWRNCAATLISSEWALTAAHCVFDSYTSNGLPTAIPSSELFVVFGGSKNYLWLSEAEANNLSSYPVSDILIHPDYSTSGHDYDIALIKLASPHYLPGPAIATETQFSALQSGERLTTIGYGYTNGSNETQPETLQITTLPYVTNDECVWSTEYDIVTDNMLCAGYMASDSHEYSTSCNGDSGGPLFKTMDGEMTLVGIVSWGLRYCADYPEVYTKVSQLRDWIMDNISGYQVVEEGSIDSASADDNEQVGRISVYHYGFSSDSQTQTATYLDIGALRFDDSDTTEVLSISDNCSQSALYNKDDSCAIRFSLPQATSEARRFMASLPVRAVTAENADASEYVDYCLRLNAQSDEAYQDSCDTIDGYEDIYSNDTSNNSSINPESSGGSCNVWLLLLMSALWVSRQLRIRDCDHRARSTTTP